METVRWQVYRYKVTKLEVGSWSSFCFLSLNRPLGRFSLLSVMSVCCRLCHCRKPTSQWTGDFWSKGVLLILACHHILFSSVSMIFLILFFWGFFLQTSILWIMGDLAGGGSVAFGVCDIWQVTGDRWHATCNTWNMIHDTWHVTCDMWSVNFFLLLLFLSIFSRFKASRSGRTTKDKNLYIFLQIPYPLIFLVSMSISFTCIKILVQIYQNIFETNGNIITKLIYLVVSITRQILTIWRIRTN